MNCLSFIPRNLKLKNILWNEIRTFCETSSSAMEESDRIKLEEYERMIAEDDPNHPDYNTKYLHKKRATHSSSTDVWKNIAYEYGLFGKPQRYQSPYQLLTWVNDPCVVVGRHQNPFSEIDMCYVSHNDIPVVRRTSGGGTVYHDQGNLNLTFFTPRNMYNRKWNLDLICGVIREKYNIDIHVNKKDDLVIGNQKISGSAAKLSSERAYHHCSLLVDTNLETLERVLKPKQNVHSRATESIRSDVVNLKTFNPEVDLGDLRHHIAIAFLKKSLLPGDDTYTMDMSLGYSWMEPMEFFQKGFMENREKLSSWDWIFGMTPKFEVEHDLIEGKISLQVIKGKVDQVICRSTMDQKMRQDLEGRLIGQRYRYDILSDLEPEREDNKPAPPGYPTPPDLSDNSYVFEKDETPWLNV